MAEWINSGWKVSCKHSRLAACWNVEFFIIISFTIDIIVYYSHSSIMLWIF